MLSFLYFVLYFMGERERERENTNERRGQERRRERERERAKARKERLKPEEEEKNIKTICNENDRIKTQAKSFSCVFKDEFFSLPKTSKCGKQN